MNQDHLQSPTDQPQAITKKAVTPSPCVSICALNDTGFCIGCYRDGNEIRLWNTYTEEQKRQVLNSCQRRASLDQAVMQQPRPSAR